MLRPRVGTLEEPARGQQIAAEEQSVLGTGSDRFNAVAAAHGSGQS